MYNYLEPIRITPILLIAFVGQPRYQYPICISGLDLFFVVECYFLFDSLEDIVVCLLHAILQQYNTGSLH